MAELKIYKELTMIKLKDWTVLNTEATVWQVAEILNNQKFVVIDWVWFNSYEVNKFEKYEPTDVDSFILSQPKEIRDILYREIEIKKQAKARININIIKTVLKRIQNEN
jgi:hypothetical protein